MESWYFSYGSNLSMDQMIERIGADGPAERGSRIARLANHRLVFQRLESAGAAFANILCPGDGVLGVVYRCSPAALEKLDRYERGYERQPVVVTDEQGQALAAIAYVVKSAQRASFGRPSDEYLELIISGARHHGLPEQYIDNIVAIALSGPSAKDQRGDCGP